MKFNMKQRADILREWYKRPSIVYEMIRFTKNREFVFLAPKFLAVEGEGFNSRMWRVHSLQHFQQVLFNGMRFDNIPGVREHTEIEDLVFNCYISLATYKNGVPIRSLANLTDQDKEKQKNLWQEMEGYDFLIDIDADYAHKTIGWSHETAKLVMQLLDKFNVEYYFFPSGAGYQFVVHLNMQKIDAVKYSYDSMAERNVYRFFTLLLTIMKNNISEMIDNKVCADERRVMKLPYSLVNYKNALYAVIPFLSREEFLNFDYSQAVPSLWKFKLGFRKVMIFNKPEVSISNEEKFIKMADYLMGLMPKARRKHG